jgi:DNA-binding MarR family transcriptional regulator
MQTRPVREPSPGLLRLLRDVERSLTTRLVGQLRAAGYPGLSPAHGKVFPFIAGDGSRVADMARAARITKQSMSDLVDLLERQGYVERRPDPSDSRAKLVCLTDRGRQVVGTANRALDEAYAELEARVGPDGLAELRRLLALCGDALSPSSSQGTLT